MFEKIKTWMRSIRESSFSCPQTKRHYYVGDVAPQSLLDHKPGDGNLGTMISVDPETLVIKAIFVP